MKKVINLKISLDKQDIGDEGVRYLSRSLKEIP
jgi:hypothetical protein